MALTPEDLQAISSLIQPLRDDMQTVKADIQSMKTDMNIMKADILNMKQDIQNMKQDIQNMKQDIQLLNDRVEKLEQRITSVELTLENVTNHNIQLLAENHINLVDKLNQAIRVQDKSILYEVQVSDLRSRVEFLEKEFAEMKTKIA
ncbi:MAG: hypothetical protein HFI83_05650 [Eubacterium sp.]|nr:hypothetical protein [Eubacterium sp.]